VVENVQEAIQWLDSYTPPAPPDEASANEYA
jgi:hypothetical protein